eukprot:TRINITY_DN935_c0_g1_i1.p1 TRINITY_DN935_c0_g1~~TRINITY_DN935_c0_g1_i1.p1  ORF type:complete len:169 (-),score=20.83 TRINITY_DN935_c0_g1_i1:328-834(-)
MVCKVGMDSFGKDMIANFSARGISTSNIISCPDASSGVASIAVSEDGSNNIIIVSGTNDLLSVEEVTARQDCIKNAQVLLTQLEINVDTTLAALKLARQHGVLTILNTAPAQALPDEIFAYADIVSPNETELETLSGRSVASSEDAVLAAREIIRRYELMRHSHGIYA